MKRISFPADVDPSPDARYSRNTRYTPDSSDAPPPIWPFLLVCAVALVLALLSGCTAADATESPSASYLEAKREARQQLAAAALCGRGNTAVWSDPQTVQCFRNQQE